jgi:hypothetical protein
MGREFFERSMSELGFVDLLYAIALDASGTRRA